MDPIIRERTDRTYVAKHPLGAIRQAVGRLFTMETIVLVRILALAGLIGLIFLMDRQFRRPLQGLGHEWGSATDWTLGGQGGELESSPNSISQTGRRDVN